MSNPNNYIAKHTNAIDLRVRWALIASAPKDGTEVFLYSKAQGAYTGSWNDDAKAWIPEGYPVYLIESAPKPTHWLEIPELFEGMNI